MSLIERIHKSRVLGRRAQVLSRHLADVIPSGGDVLDVGCGDGLIAALIHERRPDLRLSGVDVLVREDAAIAVQGFDGRHLPFDEASFDVVMFVDVLHHTQEPLELLREAARVTRHWIVLKDHLCDGLFAVPTLRFMDRVGNRRHGVSLTYNYWPLRRWEAAFAELGATVESWSQRLGQYPWPASMLFGRSLHFLARLSILRRKDVS